MLKEKKNSQSFNSRFVISLDTDTYNKTWSLLGCRTVLYHRNKFYERNFVNVGAIFTRNYLQKPHKNKLKLAKIGLEKLLTTYLENTLYRVFSFSSFANLLTIKQSSAKIFLLVLHLLTTSPKAINSALTSICVNFKLVSYLWRIFLVNTFLFFLSEINHHTYTHTHMQIW